MFLMLGCMGGRGKEKTMSIATLERAVLYGAKIAFNNPRLRLKDLREWSTGEIKPHEGEVVVRVPDPGVFVAVKTENDKRKPTGS